MAGTRGVGTRILPSFLPHPRTPAPQQDFPRRVISQRTLEFPYSLTFCFSGVHSEEARWIHAPCLKLQARGLTSDLPPCTSPLPSSLFYPSHVSLWEAADLLSIPHQQESTWGLEPRACQIVTVYTPLFSVKTFFDISLFCLQCPAPLHSSHQSIAELLALPQSNLQPLPLACA